VTCDWCLTAELVVGEVEVSEDGERARDAGTGPTRKLEDRSRASREGRPSNTSLIWPDSWLRNRDRTCRGKGASRKGAQSQRVPGL